MNVADAPQVDLLHDSAEVLERCGEFLASDPVGSNMAASLIAQGGASRVLHVHADRLTLGMAAERRAGANERTWNLSRMEDRAVTPLAEALAADEVHPPDQPIGVVGEVTGTVALADRWCELVGGAFEPGEMFRFRRLGELTRPTAPGRLRSARATDLERLTSWASAFDTDIGESSDQDHSAAVARAHAAGRLWIWLEGGEMVACAWTSVAVAGAVRIGRVYTPPERRRHGYAGALTAAVSAEQLARSDVTTVLLNTQASNASTNRLYRRLGFVHAFTAVELSLTR